MSTATSMIHPINKVVLDSSGMHIQTLEVRTSANCIPGRLVERNTSDHEVIVCAGSNPPVGWLSYEHTHKNYRKPLITTAYADGAHVAVIWGPGIILKAKLAIGVTPTKGALLIIAPAGCLTGGTTNPVAIAEETLSKTAALTDCLVRSLI